MSASENTFAPMSNGNHKSMKLTNAGLAQTNYTTILTFVGTAWLVIGSVSIVFLAVICIQEQRSTALIGREQKLQQQDLQHLREKIEALEKDLIACKDGKVG